jgi:hypothetical protein
LSFWRIRPWRAPTVAARRTRMVLATAAGTVVVSVVTAASSAPSTPGSLNLRGSLQLVSTGVECPPEVPVDPLLECFTRTGKGAVSGLGSVSETYIWSLREGPPTCPSTLAKPVATTGRLVVAEKGEIRFAFADGPKCIPHGPAQENQPQDFTITGGSGIYEGVSGSGTAQRTFNVAGIGMETWTGTLLAPGTEFDVTPPKLNGTRPKTVRAPRGQKRVRVTYTVTASDAVDGPVPVTCKPRSGSRFPLGRTRVTCSATDSSANSATVSFRVTVRASK